MGGLTLAWLTGETIIIWQQVRQDKHPPIPGKLLGGAALFALLAIIAEYPPARTAATAFAWGIDLAALLQILPAGLSGQAGGKTTSKTPGKSGSGSGGGGGTVTAV